MAEKFEDVKDDGKEIFVSEGDSAFEAKKWFSFLKFPIRGSMINVRQL